MSYPQICCCFLLFTVSPLLSAQYPSLATVGGLIGFPAVINNGDNVTFQFDIQNVGDANFDGDLYVEYIVNDIFYPYTNPESVFEDYDVKFDGSGLASGVYFSRLEINGAAHTNRMTMIK